jgi:magnesium transporter
LFVGQMFTAAAMGFFEDAISSATVLALFVPLIISVGRQLGLAGSSPFVASLVDVTGLVVYFNIARTLLGLE